MSKYALFMSKILSAGEVKGISLAVKTKRKEGLETEAVALMLRQSKTDQHRFQVGSIKTKFV
mgnify:CR=1 FL=1